MKRHLRAAPALLALAACALPASGLEFMPLAKVDLMGGQFFFEERHTSFAGNADWVASPAMKFGDSDALVPTVSGSYRRTREVRELIGGAFLTQESLDNTGSLKWVHGFGEGWSVKPGVMFKNEMITETVSEKLGKGLFDYSKLSFGLELEHQGEYLKSIRNGLNAYAIRFYHYNALSSQDLGEEIKSGNDVLDFNAYDYSLAIDAVPVEGTLIGFNALGSYRMFRDQKIVTLDGTFEDKDRTDIYGAGALSLQHKLPDWSLFGVPVEDFAGAAAGYTVLGSDQNSYDASNTRFIPDFYDYGEFSVGPSFALRFRKKLTWSGSYDYIRRDYWKRLAQTANGVYTNDAVRMETHSVSTSLSYAVTKWLTLKAQGAWQRARSNMKFEQSYRYNYSAAHYFVGLGLGF